MTGAEFGGVDIDLLADYIGGALTGTPEESAVAARIAGNPDWQAAYASLTEGMALVSAELGRFEPEPMPADLAARLDAALTTPPAGAGHEPGAIADPEPIRADLAQPPVPHLALVRGGVTERDVPNPVPERAPAAPRGRRLRWAAPIAVAAGVIAFVGFGLDYLAGRSGHSETDSSSSAAGSAEKRADAPLIARSPIGTGQLLASGTDYTRATLGLAPVEPMTAPYASSGGSAPVLKTPAAAVDTGSPLQRLTVSTALEDCLNAIEQENASGALSVESVDFARFSGAPAVIVRFTARNGHWAWASGADCGTRSGDAATLDKVPVG